MSHGLVTPRSQYAPVAGVSPHFTPEAMNGAETQGHTLQIKPLVLPGDYKSRSGSGPSIVFVSGGFSDTLLAAFFLSK